MAIPALSVPITADDAAFTAGMARAKAAVSSFASSGLGDLDAFDKRLTAMSGNLSQKLDFSQVLGRSGKSARESASAFEELLDAQDEVAKSAANLRAQIDPLGAAQLKLNAQLANASRLAAAGAISTKEHAAATALAQKAFAESRNEIDKHSTSLGVNRMQSMELLHIGKSLADQWLAGASAGRALSLESGRIFQVAAEGNGGLKGSIATVARLATGWVGLGVAVVGGVAAAVAAMSVYEARQERLQLSLNGIGRRSGLSLGGLNDVADLAAGRGSISRASAEDLAGGFASKGIDADTIGSLTGMSRQFSRVTGQSIADGGKELAAAFADPVKGADALNEKLGLLDDATRQLIRTQAGELDVMGARHTLSDALGKDLNEQTVRTNVLALAWEAVKNAASNAASAVGKAADKAVIGPTPEDRLKEVMARPDSSGSSDMWSAILAGVMGTPTGALNAGPNDKMDAWRGATEATSRALRQQRDQEQNRATLAAGDAVRGALPEVNQRLKLQADIAAITAGLGAPLEKLGVTGEEAARALGAARGQLALLGTAARTVQRDTALEVAVISARSAAERTVAEAERARVTALAAGGGELKAAAEAERVRSTAVAQATKTLLDAARESQDRLALAGMTGYERAVKQAELSDRDLRRNTYIPAANDNGRAPWSMGPVMPSSGSGAGLAMSAADRDLMIRTIIGEAGGESQQGQIAVADVIKNRLASGGYGGNLHDVITAPKQFSVWNPGDPAGAMASGVSADSAQYQRIAAIVDAVMAGKLADITGGAKNYYNPRGASPDWADKLAKIGDLTIGNHRFVGGTVSGSIGGAGGTPDIAGGVKSDNLGAVQKDYISGPLTQSGRELTAQNAFLRVQAESFGKGADEIARMAKEQELLNGFAVQGITLTDEQKARVHDLAAGYGQAAKASQDLAQHQHELVAAMDGVRGTAKDALGTFVNDLRHGKSAGDALRDSLSHVIEKLLDMGENAIVGGLFGQQGKPGGGLFGNAIGGLFGNLIGGGGSSIAASAAGSLGGSAAINAAGSASGGGILSWLGSLFHFADGGIMTSSGPLPLRRYAGGGVADSPQVAMYGEGKHPEAYVPLPDGRSIPVNVRVPQFIRQGGQPRAAAPVNVTHAPVINMTPADGVTPAQLAQVLAKNNDDFALNILPVIANAQQRYG